VSIPSAKSIGGLIGVVLLLQHDLGRISGSKIGGFCQPRAKD